MQNVIISQALIKDRILICSAACTSDNGGKGRQNSRIVLFTLKLRRTACTRIQSKTTGRLTAFCTDPSIILPSPLLFILLLRSAPSPPISALHLRKSTYATSLSKCMGPVRHHYANVWAPARMSWIFTKTQVRVCTATAGLLAADASCPYMGQVRGWPRAPQPCNFDLERRLPTLCHLLSCVI